MYVVLLVLFGKGYTSTINMLVWVISTTSKNTGTVFWAILYGTKIQLLYFYNQQFWCQMSTYILIKIHLIDKSTIYKHDDVLASHPYPIFLLIYLLCYHSFYLTKIHFLFFIQNRHYPNRKLYIPPLSLTIKIS